MQIGLRKRTDESQKIRAGKVRRLHTRYFTNQFPATLDHKAIATIADAIE